MKIAGWIKGFLKYRPLLEQLVEKDIKLKYRRSFLGYVWSVLNPLMIMVIMVIVFSNIFRANIENYPSYLIIGQTMFNFMSDATTQGMTSIVFNADLMKKTYVPKYIFTMSKVISSFVNTIFSLGALLVVFFITRVHFSLYMLFIPVILLEIFLFVLGISLFLAQGNVFFRDIQYIYHAVLTAWSYLTPLFYPLSMLPEKAQNIIKICNPMYSYIQQFRTVVLDVQLPDPHLVIYGFVVGFISLVIGTLAFLKTQDKFILYI